MSDIAVSSTNLLIKKHKSILLNNISFEVGVGTICGLLGPSGAGKTTLMRVLIGLQIPTSGEAAVLGTKPGSKYNRKKVGYVTQSPSIYPDLTVAQNLNYFSTLAGAGKLAAVKALDKVHLLPQARQLVSTLSGGQKTRVSLAIALLGDPELLIMDEPTVGLDPLLRQDLWNLFKKMADEGRTLIISSHVMEEAAHCQQLLLLREGELLWSDSQAKLLKATGLKDVEAAFIQLVKTGKKP